MNQVNPKNPYHLGIMRDTWKASKKIRLFLSDSVSETLLVEKLEQQVWFATFIDFIENRTK